MAEKASIKVGKKVTLSTNCFKCIYVVLLKNHVRKKGKIAHLLILIIIMLHSGLEMGKNSATMIN